MDRPAEQDATARTVKVEGHRWRAPSFFDPQINGAMGIAFNSPVLNAEGIRAVASVCRGHGIGGFLATVITDGASEIGNAFRNLESARQHDAELARWIPGYHLEGPYIASEDGPRGAHPRQHAHDPDWNEFQRWQEAAGGLIRMVTLAPERPGAITFIERAAKLGIVVAIGHTNADAATIHAAVEAGARTSTHLGNGCHAVLPRHENPIWSQLAEDRLWASIIADGHHLPASLVKCILRSKTPQRLLLTCDAGSLAGLPPGRYADWGTELEVLPSGRIVVPGTPFLAGSGLFTDTCVGNIIGMAGITLEEAVDLASVQPRRLLGLPPTDEMIEFDWQPGTMLENIRFVNS